MGMKWEWNGNSNGLGMGMEDSNGCLVSRNGMKTGMGMEWEWELEWKIPMGVWLTGMG